MKRRLLLAVILFCSHLAYSQKIKEYPVKVGETPANALPQEAKYIYSSFKTGKVSFRDGTSATRPFNYNFLLDEMHFLNDAGDTLAIADPVTINNLVIDSVSFRYDKGYLREALKKGAYKLAVKQEMTQVADKTRGGYDMPLGTAAIKTYGTINGTNSQMYHLQVNKDMLFQVIISFYIADASNHFVKANKKNFYTFFEEKKVAGYLKNHSVNFDNEEDLKSLLRYCAE